MKRTSSTFLLLLRNIRKLNESGLKYISKMSETYKAINILYQMKWYYAQKEKKVISNSEMVEYYLNSRKFDEKNFSTFLKTKDQSSVNNDFQERKKVSNMFQPSNFKPQYSSGDHLKQTRGFNSKIGTPISFEDRRKKVSTSIKRNFAQKETQTFNQFLSKRLATVGEKEIEAMSKTDRIFSPSSVSKAGKKSVSPIHNASKIRPHYQTVKNVSSQKKVKGSSLKVSRPNTEKNIPPILPKVNTKTVSKKKSTPRSDFSKKTSLKYRSKGDKKPLELEDFYEIFNSRFKQVGLHKKEKKSENKVIVPKPLSRVTEKSKSQHPLDTGDTIEIFPKEEHNKSETQKLGIKKETGVVFEKKKIVSEDIVSSEIFLDKKKVFDKKISPEPTSPSDNLSLSEERKTVKSTSPTNDIDKNSTKTVQPSNSQQFLENILEEFEKELVTLASYFASLNKKTDSLKLEKTNLKGEKLELQNQVQQLLKIVDEQEGCMKELEEKIKLLQQTPSEVGTSEKYSLLRKEVDLLINSKLRYAKKDLEELKDSTLNLVEGVNKVFSDTLSELEEDVKKTKLGTHQKTFIPSTSKSTSVQKEIINRFLDKLNHNIKIRPNAFKSEIGEKIVKESAKQKKAFATEILAKIYLQQNLKDRAILVYKELKKKNPANSSYYDRKIKEIKK